MSHCLFSAVPTDAEWWPIALPLCAGVAAIYLLLPRPKAYPVLWGAGLGLLALVLAGVLLTRSGVVSPEVVLFWSFSAIGIISGALLVTQHNPARAALAFTLVVLSTCGLFLLLAAPFLMAATIIIYAGAIIVTFLFVIMLAQQSGWSDADDRSREPLLTTITGFVLLGTLLFVLQRYDHRIHEAERELDPLLERTRNIEALDTRQEMVEQIGEEGSDANLFLQFKKLYRSEPQWRGLDERVDRVADEWSPIDAKDSDAATKSKARLQELRAIAAVARQRLSWLPPANVTPLSNLPPRTRSIWAVRCSPTSCCRSSWAAFFCSSPRSALSPSPSAAREVRSL
jgi:NADH:ubiquinone oxidoreductase subunit 6 (subunit J)